MKIWQRGAILITVPLVLEGVGLYIMHGALTASQKDLDEERKQVYVMEEINQTFVNFVRTTGLIGTAALTPDKTSPAALRASLAATKKHLGAFKNLVEDNAEMVGLVNAMEKQGIKPMEQLILQSSSGEAAGKDTYSRLMALARLKPVAIKGNAANRFCLELLNMQRHRRDQALLEQANSSRRLYAILYGLSAFNIVVAAVALMLFQSSISSRLRVLLRKAKRLPRLKDAGDPLGGDDEFAELDQVLHQAFDRLVEAKEFRSNLSSMMVHDLRSPLNAIGVTTALLEHGPKAQLNEYATNKIHNIGNNAERMLRLINEFLELEKLQSSEIVVDMKPCSSLAVIEEIFDSLAEMAAYKHIDLVRIGPDIEVFIDRQKTSQVLANLVANAIKFSPDGSKVTVAVAKVADKSTGREEARFDVCDQGPGLSPDLQAKLFTKFAKGDTPSAFKGSGLGLFISKWLIESQGGNLSCKSAPEAGTAFSFTVPLKGRWAAGSTAGSAAFAGGREGAASNSGAAGNGGSASATGYASSTGSDREGVDGEEDREDDDGDEEAGELSGRRIIFACTTLALLAVALSATAVFVSQKQPAGVYSDSSNETVSDRTSELPDADADQLFAAMLRNKSADVKSLDATDIPVFIHDQSLERLKAFNKLDSINLSQHAYITPAGLRVLAGLPKLKSLDLSDTCISDSAISEINKMKSLRKLILAGTNITDSGINQLSGDLPLGRIDLANLTLTNNALKNFTRFKSLDSIRLENCSKIDDDGIFCLIGDSPGQTTLKEDYPFNTLSLQGTKVSDRIVDVIARMPALKRLELADCPAITDNLLDTIVKRRLVPGLNLLDVRRCPRVSERAVEAFRSSMPDCEVMTESKDLSIQ